MAGMEYENFSGVLFKLFQKSKELVKRHPLDTNIDKYYKTVKELVIPEFRNLASEVPGYPERIEKLFSHSYPAAGDIWSFTVELIYRTVVDKAHQTEENITKMYIIRAIMDMFLTSFTIHDDCTDKAEYRRGKKCWHVVCDGGTAAAIYDSLQMGMFPFFLLKIHFRTNPGYVRMLEHFSKVLMNMSIGQTLDTLGQGNASPSMNDYRHICKYKAEDTVIVGPGLILLHAGIFSEELFDKTMEIFAIIAQLVQIWDDFADYYCTPEQTGELPADFMNGATTWLSATAMEKFTPSQAQEFMECYGSSEPVKIKRVYELYNEIDMPRLYVEYMIESYNRCKILINALPHPKLREAYLMCLEWLVGQNSNVMKEQ